MVNFLDPITIVKESDEIKRFWNLVDGIFIWEFLVTLDYEWSVIRGRRPYRWTIWIYTLTRVATLATVFLNIFSVDIPARINCQVIVDLQFIFCYLAFTASSLLIVLRIIAIWDRKKIVVVLATGVWGINIAFLIQGILRFRTSREVDGCVYYLDGIRLSTIVTFVTDTILLLVMLFGLHRLRRRSHGDLMALGRLLWNQGIVWLFLAIVAELTPTVLILLNLNQILNLMFQVPWLITMSIAATRMYRSLSNFLSSDVSLNIPPTSGHSRIASESTPQANRFGSDVSGQPLALGNLKPLELIVDIVNDCDIEGRAEKQVV